MAVAVKFCTVTPDICGFSLWNLLFIIILVSIILRSLLDFWKICAPALKVFDKLLWHGLAHRTYWTMDRIIGMLYLHRGE